MKIINNNFEKYFPKKDIIVMLHAHADDESFLSAGIINEFIIRNYDILLIYLAVGLVAGEKKTNLRQEELFDALGLLGVKNVEFLKYCEPKYIKNGKPLCQQSIQKISKEVKKVIQKKGIKDYILFSYDKNGGYGNRDHRTVHKVGRLLFKNSSTIRSLFEVTIPREIYLDWFSKNKEGCSKRCLPKLNYWSTKFGLKKKEINYLYSLNSIQLDKKREALSKHESQVKRDEFPLALRDNDFHKLFSKEYFACVDRSFT